MTKKEQVIFDGTKNMLNEKIVKMMLKGEAVDEKTMGALAIINHLSDELEAVNADKQEEA